MILEKLSLPVVWERNRRKILSIYKKSLSKKGEKACRS